jgi:hypothetical protein
VGALEDVLILRSHALPQPWFLVIKILASPLVSPLFLAAMTSLFMFVVMKEK